MAWAEFPEASLTVLQGAPKTLNSSGTAMRSFCGNCGDCGTGLFYRNAGILPGQARQARRIPLPWYGSPSTADTGYRPWT